MHATKYVVIELFFQWGHSRSDFTDHRACWVLWDPEERVVTGQRQGCDCYFFPRWTYTGISVAGSWE